MKLYFCVPLFGGIKMIKGEEMDKMKMKNAGLLKCLVVMCLSGLLLMSLAGCKGSKYDEDRFDVKLNYGYGNNLEINAYAPFYVEVTNNGSNFEGAVQMIVPSIDNRNIMYEKEISIQQGASKSVELVAFVEVITKKVNIRIVNSNGKVIWEELQDCSTLSDLRKVNVGILSDDFSALGYMDHQPFASFTTLTTQIYELSADTLQSDWHAFDMLDVIVISDFSTDLLSDAQINALSLWVNDGGLLMVGTGSTANKTLAKLNGNLFSVTAEGLKTYNTKFGAEIANFDYNYVQNTYYGAYDDSVYESFFKENYDALYESLEEEYLSDFCQDYGYSDDVSTWDYYMEDDFYYYCFYEFYEVYLEMLQGGTSGNDNNSKYSYVKADILQMLVENERGGSTFYGETQSGSNYELAYAVPRGDGYIFLCGADFTKTPFSNYDANDEMFIHWVESLIGQKCYEECQSYSNYSYGSYHSNYNGRSMDYYKDEIFEGVDSATVPPILIYVGILFLYIVAILVLYFVMKSKKKTIRLWIIYPLMAAGISILIFCIGFSTRIHRPVINAVTFLQPNGSNINQITYTSVTVPGNKEYTIGFSPAQGAAYDIPEHYSYYDESDMDLSKYTIGYKYGYESTDISLGNMEAMGSANFKMLTSSIDNRNIILKIAKDDTHQILLSNNKPNVVVTNAFGCKLEHAALICDGQLFYIGDMANGETVDGRMTREEESGYSIYSDGLGKGVLMDESAKTGLGLLFGSINGSYDEYLCRLRALNAVSDYIDNSEKVTFIAFPTDDIAEELQGSSHYNERRTEMIYIEMDEQEFLLSGMTASAGN